MLSYRNRQAVIADHALDDPSSGLRTLLLGRIRTGRQGALALRVRSFAWVASPHHAYVTQDRYHRHFVLDVSPSGGTYVNDARLPVAAPHQLEHGDIITLGGPRMLREHGAMVANPYAYQFSRLTDPRTSLARGRRPPASSAVARRERESVLDAVTCSVCSHPMSDAHNLPCGHLFCKSCVLTWLASHATCPSCRAPAGVNDARPVVGFGELAEVAVTAHGSRDDIAALRVRQQHAQLATRQVPTPRGPARQREPPIVLTREDADDEMLLLRGVVDGCVRYFVTPREDD
jgi:hypothetical protein